MPASTINFRPRMFSSPIGARSAAVMLAMAPFISTSEAFSQSVARPFCAAFAPSRSMMLRTTKSAASIAPIFQQRARFAAPVRHFSRVHMKYSTKEVGTFPSEVYHITFYKWRLDFECAVYQEYRLFFLEDGKEISPWHRLMSSQDLYRMILLILIVQHPYLG